MNELNFIGKKYGGRACSKVAADVYVSHSAKTASGEVTYFSLRNGIESKIAPETNSVAYAVSGSRLYFKEVPAKDGYFLTENKKNASPNKYFSVSGERHRELHDWAEKYGGEFELLFDCNLNLWCIDVNGAIFRGVTG